MACDAFSAKIALVLDVNQQLVCANNDFSPEKLPSLRYFHYLCQQFINII
jgi:hypothetical protein